MTNFLQLGQAAINARNTAEAVQWFEKAVQRDPCDATALACLGQSLCWLNQHKQGLDYLHKAGKQLVKKARKSKDTSQLLLLVEQLQFWEDYQGSLELVKQAVQINNSDLRSFQILAHTYSRLNKNSLALSASKQALKKAPDNPVLNILQATLEAREGLYDVAKRRLKNVIAHPGSGNEEKFRAHKELARILDKTGEYQNVFEHLHKSAELSSLLPEVQKIDHSLIGKILHKNISEFDSELLARWSETKFSTTYPVPIFLIGFLRSGTTLTQEVLDAHPNTFVSDEADLVFPMREEINKISGISGSIPAQLRQLDKNGIEHLREFYWNKAMQRFGEEVVQKAFIDKTTMNTFDIGLINHVFPEAKIIFVMRDPRDVCISCFMQNMKPSPSTIHLLRWESIINLYSQTMQWWMRFKTITSADYLEFRYEDAISQFESTYRKIFDFLELPWDSAVIDFHNHAANKYIVSPSFDQVSQPLYSTSVARWRYYESEFNAVKQDLMPYIKAFEYLP